MAGKQRQTPPKDSTDEKATLEAQPDWDRMGQIADRLLAGAPKKPASKKPKSD